MMQMHMDPPHSFKDYLFNLEATNKSEAKRMWRTNIKDAVMVVNFDPHRRSYSKKRLFADQVIDVTSTTDKQLPGQMGLPAGKVNLLNAYRIKLPEGQEKPFIIN